MKHALAAAAIVALAAAFTPATAEDRPVTKAPQKTLGDEGKLPPTSTMTDEMAPSGHDGYHAAGYNASATLCAAQLTEGVA